MTQWRMKSTDDSWLPLHFGPLQAVLYTVDLASRRLAQQTERFSDSASVPPLCLKWDKTVIFTLTDLLRSKLQLLLRCVVG